MLEEGSQISFFELCHSQFYLDVASRFEKDDPRAWLLLPGSKESLDVIDAFEQQNVDFSPEPFQLGQVPIVVWYGRAFVGYEAILEFLEMQVKRDSGIYARLESSIPGYHHNPQANTRRQAEIVAKCEGARGIVSSLKGN